MRNRTSIAPSSSRIAGVFLPLFGCLAAVLMFQALAPNGSAQEGGPGDGQGKKQGKKKGGPESFTPGPPRPASGPCDAVLSATRPLSDVLNPQFTLLDGAGLGGGYAEGVGAGDIDGDGFSDVVVGMRGDTVNGDSKGNVFVYRGSKNGVSSTPTWTLTGTQAKEEFGRTLTVGDINGDGFADVIVGAHGFDGGKGFHQGKFYVFLGGKNGLSTTASQTFVGEHRNDEFGRSFTVADVTGDGIKDLLVGASGYNGDLAYQGKAYVYKGTKQGLGETPIFSGVGEHPDDEFGFAMAGADVNKDGRPDLIIGAGGLTKGGAASKVPGAVYVYLGTANGFASTPSFKVDGEANGDHFGEALAAVGDVNGDGYQDVAVGAHDYSCGNGSAGKIYVYLGGPNGLSKDRAWTAIGKATGAPGGVTGLGRTMAPAGDLNGDGYADFLASAPAGTKENGAGVYIFLGGPKGFTGDPAVATADGPSSNIGLGLFLAGDINGDRAQDILAGAPAGGEKREGQARVYYGVPHQGALKKK